MSASHPVQRRSLGPLALGVTLIGGAGWLVLAPRPNDGPSGVPVQERLLRFDDGPDGSVLIHEQGTGKLLRRIPVAEGGFVRGTLRALARERRQDGEGREPPFRLALWPGGQLTLDDMATGRRIDLTAFGIINAEPFRRLLTTNGEEE